MVKLAKKRKTNSSKKSHTSNPMVRNTNTKIKTAKGRKTSSSRWLQRQLNDPYVQASKRDGYRSRAAYKLLQMNEKFDFIKPHSRVLDLGAAPGGWSQVVASITGANTSDIDSQIIALDILPIEPIPGVKILSYDFMKEGAEDLIRDEVKDPLDVILSDISPPLSGHSNTDHLRIIAIAEAAYSLSIQLLGPNGVFITKVFQGGTEKKLLDDIKENFSIVKHLKPPASRKESSELYLVAMGYNKI